MKRICESDRGVRWSQLIYSQQSVWRGWRWGLRKKKTSIHGRGSWFFDTKLRKMFWYVGVFSIVEWSHMVVFFSSVYSICDCIFYLLQHFPRFVTKKYLWWNQKAIEIIDADTEDRYYGEVHYEKRNKMVVKAEKFIGKDWYEYAKKNKLRRGDKFGFMIRDPSASLFVYILNHWGVVDCCFLKTMEDVLKLSFDQKGCRIGCSWCLRKCYQVPA